MSRTFAGTGYIQTPPNAVYNTLPALTMAAWVYLNSYAFDATIFVKNPNGVFSPYLAFNHSTGNIFTDVGGSGGESHSVTSAVVPLNTWTHVAVTFDSAGDKKMHVYINGVEASYSFQSVLGGTVLDDSGEGYFLGSDSFGDQLDGDMAEAAIWNVALSGSDIVALAASTTGAAAINPTHLVGYWHLCGTLSP